MHVYTTKFGLEIHEEQRDAICDSGLLTNTQSLKTGRSHPLDRPQLYEGATLEQMWLDCMALKDSPDKDFLVWYIHTKGASVGAERQGSYKAIRQMIQAIVIEQWQHCVYQLETNPGWDCYGAYWPTDDRQFYPHNMWWAKASHIRQLPSPREWAERLCGRTGENVRYGYEDWLTAAPRNDGIPTLARAYGPYKP